MYSISMITNRWFSKMRLKQTTLGCFIVYMMVDSFLRIERAREDSLSLFIIFKADFSPVSLFFTRRTTP